MHIVINARVMSWPPHGGGKYLEIVTQILCSCDFTVTLLSDRPLDEHYEVPPAVKIEILSARSAWWWEQAVVPHYLARIQPQIYFATSNRGVPLRQSDGIVYLLGLLDVIPWLYPRECFWEPPRFWTLRHEAIPQILSWWRSDHILTISQTSRRDILRFTPRKRVTAIAFPMKGQPNLPCLNPRPQFIYLGGSQARKRTDNLLRAFALFQQSHPEFRLVFIGARYDKERQLATELGVHAAVDFTGIISDAERDRLLRESTAFIYPSVYEGWGLGLAEAMIANTVVVAGTGGAQAEVGGSALLRIDPLDEHSIAAAMRLVLDPQARNRLLQRNATEIPRLLSSHPRQNLVRFLHELATDSRCDPAHQARCI